MSKQKNQKSKHKNEPTYPDFTLNQNESESGYNEGSHQLKRENFDSDNPLISGYGGHYGHESELKTVKPKSPKDSKSPAQKKMRKNKLKK